MCNNSWSPHIAKVCENLVDRSKLVGYLTLLLYSLVGSLVGRATATVTCCKSIKILSLAGLTFLDLEELYCVSLYLNPSIISPAP